MNVKITKPDGVLYDGDAVLLQLPGTGGKFEILKGHAPIVASLQGGTIRLQPTDGDEQRYEIRGGVVEGSNDTITILVQ